MEITFVDAFRNMVLSDSPQKVADSLEFYGLWKGSACPFTVLGWHHQVIASTIITTALTMSCYEESRPSERLIDEIIVRTACLVDTQAFLELVIGTALPNRVLVNGYEGIPDRLSDALENGTYNHMLDEEVRHLHRAAFEILLMYLVKERIRVGHGLINAVLIQRLRQERMLTDELILMYMGLALRRTFDKGTVSDDAVLDHCKGCVDYNTPGCSGTDAEGYCIA